MNAIDLLIIFHFPAVPSLHFLTSLYVPAHSFGEIHAAFSTAVHGNYGTVCNIKQSVYQ